MWKMPYINYSYYLNLYDMYIAVVHMIRETEKTDSFKAYI